MKRRRLLLILATCVASVALAFLVLPREREPKYDGVPLSMWLERGRSDRGESIVAIRQIGTNALPFLLRWIQYEPPGWRRFVSRNFSKIPSRIQNSRVLRWLIVDKAENRANIAVTGIGILGPDASSAMPELIRLADNASAPETSRRAWMCMSLMTQSFHGDFPEGFRRR
jgi:hypothetical protein